ncbi:hypothetical protein sos41_01430 [Alphaproteobacteria bacterium SO-S41]|nr:hypothetical protein sos41_01430 [Alphaproteobacteria bacterium SO-S41]
MIARSLCLGLVVAALMSGAAFAETPKGPVHITQRGASHDDGAAEEAAAAAEEAKAAAEEARRDAIEVHRDAVDGLADAREGLKDAEKGLEESKRDLAQMEAGDFSRTMTIEDDKVVKCGDPNRYPGCIPYTDAEKAEMVAEMRQSLKEAEAGLEEARRGLAEAERELASAR